MGVARDDLDLADRLIGEIARGLKADGSADDPGALFKVGRLRIRRDAGRALAEDGAAEDTALVARELLLEIAGAFPGWTDWRPARGDARLHLRFEAIGRAVLVDGVAL